MSRFTQILYQIVFGAKNCTRFLNLTNQEELFRYMAGFSVNKNCYPYIIGGHENHIHLILSLHPSICLASFVKELKTASHKFIRETKRASFPEFTGWQVGYGGFTYNYSAKDNLIKYVRNQEEHHRIKTFKEELIELLDEFHIDYKEKYLFI